MNTVQQQIYEELNKFVGGDLEGFLRDCIEEKYEGKPYNDFFFEHVGERLLMFGFYSNGRIPDPFFTVAVEERTAKVKGIETLLGYVSSNTDVNGMKFKQGDNDDYCFQFMQEMNQRKASGIMKRISRKNTLTGEEM